MARIRLEQTHVAVGQPLPFALLDEQGRVLLKYGYIFQSQSQLERMVERGAYFEEVIDEAPQQHRQAKEDVSVYLRLSELSRDFEQLIDKAPADYGAALGVAGQIQTLCGLDSDAALANIQLDNKIRYSLRHCFHAAILTEILLKRLNRPEEIRRYAVAGALTMNICMLELQEIFYRQNAPLTAEQKNSVVAHPQMAVKALREQGIAYPVWLEVVEHHHEMIDASGYPRRLPKSELSIESQAVSLADRYCAMVSERAYRAGVLPGMAAKDLFTRQSATVEPALAAAFMKEVGIYPPGAVVSLANGEVAVVVKRLLTPQQPLVRSLRAANSVRFAEPPKRLTNNPAFVIKEALSMDIVKDSDLALLWPPV